MKKIILLAIIVGMTMVAHAQTVITVDQSGAIEKVRGVDTTKYYLVYFLKEKNVKPSTAHYFVIIRPQEYNLKTFELYSGKAGTPLAKVADAMFARDDDKLTITSSASGTINLSSFMSEGDWVVCR